MRGKTNQRHTLRLLLLLILAASSASNAAAQEEPPCLTVVHAQDASGTIFTLMENGSTMFGDRAVVRTTCEGPYKISSDGLDRAYTNGSSTFSLLVGVHDYTFRFDSGLEVVFENVTVYPSEVWTSAYYNIDPEAAPVTYFVDNAELQARDVMVAFGSALIIWATSTFIVWRLVSAYIDRGFVEEVLS